jgi:hypothetical protein
MKNGIINHTNTKYELEITKTRLDLVINKKIELYQKYVGIKSPSLEEKSNNNFSCDKFALYVNEITKTNEVTGMSIEEEITNLLKSMNKMKLVLSKIECDLKQLKDIESRLYRKIVIDGYRVSKAVEEVASESYYSQQHIWRFYDNIKEYIRKLKK